MNGSTYKNTLTMGCQFDINDIDRYHILEIISIRSPGDTCPDSPRKTRKGRSRTP